MSKIKLMKFNPNFLMVITSDQGMEVRVKEELETFIRAI